MVQTKTQYELSGLKLVRDNSNSVTCNTLRSPQRGVRSTLLSSCYFWISICVDNASLALYFYRNMILICNRREPMTASSVIVRKISLAVAYTIEDSLWWFVQGMLILFRILKVSVRDRRSSKWASRSNGKKQRMYIYIYIKEQRTIFKKNRGALATPRGQSLWILCASTGYLWIFIWFCGLI